MAIIKRLEKGSELTHEELDNNFTELEAGMSGGGGFNQEVMKTIKEMPLGTGNQFGTSMAVSDTKIIVGTVYSGDVDGLVSIYDNVGTFIRHIPTPADIVNGDDFGKALAISNTVIVSGQPNDNTPTDNEGSAYIFDTDGTLITKILASDPATSDNFGWAVSASDTKVVVGSPYSNTNNAGSAYIYDVDGTFVTKIVSPAIVDNANFGYSVAVSNTKIAIGCPWHQGDNFEYYGFVYLFNLDGTYDTRIQSSEPQDREGFGVSVAVSDTHIVVGAYQSDIVEGTDSYEGSAYIYTIDGTFVAKLVAETRIATQTFGRTVSISDNFVAVGGSYDNTGANGVVEVFDLLGNRLNSRPSGALDKYVGHAFGISNT
ncbi:MAG: hypothetical protein DRP97_06385, partial [Candidatus Latescibacterota bacterium]